MVKAVAHLESPPWLHSVAVALDANLPQTFLSIPLAAEWHLKSRSPGLAN